MACLSAMRPFLLQQHKVQSTPQGGVAQGAPLSTQKTPKNKGLLRLGIMRFRVQGLGLIGFRVRGVQHWEHRRFTVLMHS